MALQSITLTVGAARDSDNNDKNYVSGQDVYIKKTNGTLANIYRDLAGTSQIAQDGLSNVTNSNGQFTFFVEAGDYNAEYAGQVTPITVVGPDYFNSRIDETVNQIILDLSTSRGFRVKGTFAAGFTYELPNDVGLDASGNAWIYTDVDALPFTVPAATSPSSPTYTQVTFSDHNSLTNRNITGAHNASAIALANGSVEDALSYVTPEMFGDVGSGINDNAIFDLAIAAGKPIKAFGSQYRLDKYVASTAIDLEFGASTEIIGTQTGGVKLPILTVRGGGLQGSAVNVTALDLADLKSNVTVDSVAGLSVGDSVLLRENEPLRLETGVSSPALEDFNYYEFLTIKEINGLVVTFDEYIAGEFDAANSMTLQKVEFLENVNVRGGVYVGGNPTGGGLLFEYCRNSKGNAFASGVGDNINNNERMGGAAGELKSCLECEMEVGGKWTLFSSKVENIQACNVKVVGGKKTSNGGFIIINSRSSNLGPIVQDNPGDINGDGFNVNGRSYGNTIGPMIISGAKCYTSWIRQPVEDNVFLPINSMAGITAVCNLYGNKNNFTLLKSSGHAAPALVVEGDDNTVSVDWEGWGSGLVVDSGTKSNKITGRLSSKDTFDVTLGSVADTEIDLFCGGNGVNYASGVVENYSNKISTRGNAIYNLGASYTSNGYIFSRHILGITNTPTPLQTIGKSTDTNGLKNLTPTSSDTAECYLIKLQTSVSLADTYSEYRLVGRQGAWQINAVVEGVSSYAPRLSDVSGVINIAITETTTANVNVSIEKF